MSAQDFRYVFGPVRSGRLGVSLGLDLLGEAICTMDCLYCEVGPTTSLTCERKPYVPAKDILDELARWQAEIGRPLDFVTLGGMGEPCLNSELAEVIAGAKRIVPGVPVAVLTNATLLGDPQVRAELMAADVVLPSLDSLVPEEFGKVNRPVAGLDPEQVARSILEFSRAFPGRIFLEVLLVAGVNDSEENLTRLKGFVAELAPARVDVVTMTRPGAWPGAKAVSPEVLARWRAELASELAPKLAAKTPKSDAETVKPDRSSGQSRETVLTQGRIREIVRQSLTRRPQTMQDLCDMVGGDANQVREALAALIRQGLVREQDGFYLPAGRAE